jgi:hypothetical protein
MTDPNPDDVAHRGALYSIDSERSPSSGVSNRVYKLIWLVGAMALLVLVTLSLVRVQGSLGRLEGRLIASSVPSAGKPDGVLPEVQALESRLARVISASVESKLRRLEHSVERGTLGGEDLQLLESVAGELRLLRAQPVGLSGLPGPDGPLEHPRYKALPSPTSELQSKDVLEQIAHLRTFVYAVVICLALFLTIVLGLWYSTERRVRMIASTPRRQLAAMRTAHENQRGV